VKHNVTTYTGQDLTDQLIMVVGNYGSGKTEISVNLSILLAKSGKEVQIADLDIVNPYFRCREAFQLMQAHGVRVVVPPGSQAWADLPIVLPEIKGMLSPKAGQVNLFDVGGDPVGAKLLASMVEHLADRPYALWQVINSRRPFTDTIEGCLNMKQAIEQASRLKVTALVANSHLVTETTPEVIVEGYRLAREVSERSGAPIEFVTAMGDLAQSPVLAKIEAPVFQLQRYMLPPWLKKNEAGLTDECAPAGLPAARAKPLGRR
jgi:hypothetical protein